MGIYREQAEDMLKRWGREVMEGGSKPNILLLEYIGGEGSVWPSGPAMFSPHASRADEILKEIGYFDLTYVEMLSSRAFGLTYDDIARNNKTHRNWVQIQMEGAFGAFESGMATRIHRGVWKETKELRGKIIEMRKERRKLLEFVEGM